MKYLALVLILCLSAQYTMTQQMKTTVKKPVAKASVGVKVAVPKIKIGVTAAAKPKVVVPKVPKVSIKIGASSKVVAKPKVALKGSCPQATAFGMVAGPLRSFAKGTNKMCPGMTSACCTASSMTNYYSTITKGSMKKMSAVFWSVSRSLSASVKLYSGFNKTMVAAAKKLTGIRRLQRGKSSSTKRSSSRARVRVSKPRTRVRVRVSKPRTRVRIGVRTAARTSSTMRIRIRKSTRKARITASNFLVGTVARARFVSNWNHLTGVAQNRQSIQVAAKDCFRSLAGLKTQMACLACDNTQTQFTKNGITLKAASLNTVVTKCAKFLYWLPQIRTTILNAADLVLAMKSNAKVQTLKDAVVAAGFPSMSGCFATPSTAEVAWTSTTDRRGKCGAKPAAKVSVKITKRSSVKPKVSLKLGASATSRTKLSVKPKVSLKIRASAKPKLSLKAKAAVKPKASLSFKAKAGLRMLQAMKVKVAAKPKVSVKVGLKKPTLRISAKPKVAVKVGINSRVIRKPTAKISIGTSVPKTRITIRKRTTAPVVGSTLPDFSVVSKMRCGKNNKQVVAQIKDAASCFKSKFMTTWVNTLVKGKAGDSARPMKEMVKVLSPVFKLLDALMREANSRVKMFWVRFTGKKWAFPISIKKLVKKASAKLRVKVSGVLGSIKAGLKKTGAAISAGIKKTGASIKVGVKKAGVAIKKTGLKIKAGAIKTGLKIKAGAIKTGLKIKAGVKKTGLAIKAGAAKISAGAKVAFKPKAKVSLKLSAKSRRVQAAPAAPATAAPATAAPAATTDSAIKNGGTVGAKLPESGVKIPEEIEGDGQASGLLMKSFATFCILMGMFIIN